MITIKTKNWLSLIHDILLFYSLPFIIFWEVWIVLVLIKFYTDIWYDLRPTKCFSFLIGTGMA